VDVKLIDLAGRRFNRLVVLSRAMSSRTGDARWRCVCDCGAETTVLGYNLRNSNTMSCGCLKQELQVAYCHRASKQESDHYDRFYAPDAKAFYMADVPLCNEGED